jgi:hypothetical protein
MNVENNRNLSDSNNYNNISSNKTEKNALHQKIDTATAHTFSSKKEETSEVTSFKIKEQKKILAQKGWSKVKKSIPNLTRLIKGIKPERGLSMTPEHWLESLSTYHVAKDREAWLKSGIDKDFYSWEKEKYANVSSKNNPHVKQLDDVARQEHKLSITDGQIFQNGKPFSTQSQQPFPLFIYVIDLQGNFYAGRDVRNEFHHSSFLAGGPVLATGEIEVDSNGRLKKITMNSGHYVPTHKEMLNALSYFKEHGVDLTNVSVVEMTNVGTIKNPQMIEAEYNNAEVYLNKKAKVIPDKIDDKAINAEKKNGTIHITVEQENLEKMIALLNYKGFNWKYL